jgi:DNA-binding transcriptional LysR family regulator
MQDFVGNRLEWDDLRLIMSVARSGSFARAAAALGASTPTIFRKARTLERRLGTLVFHRDNAGVTLTAAGREAAALAERIAEDVASLEARIGNADTEAAGTIRFATVDTLVAGPLMPVLSEFQRAFPSIVLDVRSGVGMADLRHREADVALRAGGEPPDDLVGRRLCRIAVGVYRAAGCTWTEGMALDRAPWIAPSADLAHLASAKWLKDKGYADRAVMRVNSLFTLAVAVANGLGLGILPCYLADGSPGLVRVGKPIGALASDLWFLTHAELRHTARIRALSDHLAEASKKLKSRFEGETSDSVLS